MAQTTLYYRQGSSDKVYQASICPKDGGYVVGFAYGRRGNTLQTGTKTSRPVPYDEARRIYDKLIAEKTAKGYTPGTDGTPYRQTDQATRVSGLLPQLLNPISADQATRLIADRDWCLQEKHDGQRLLLRKTATTVEGINRKGLFTGLSELVLESAREIPGTFTLDGEAIGDMLIAFDLLELDGVDYRPLSYTERMVALIQLLPHPGRPINCAATAFQSTAKAGLLHRLRADGREGAVFKRLSASYQAGRPASGGDALKLKFYETATVIVTAVNPQRSVAIGLWENKDFVPVGNVTIPPSCRIPVPGALIEIRYLYAFPGGSVYQPVYLGQRNDIDPTECVIGQLKFKAREAA